MLLPPERPPAWDLSSPETLSKSVLPGSECCVIRCMPHKRCSRLPPASVKLTSGVSLPNAAGRNGRYLEWRAPAQVPCKSRSRLIEYCIVGLETHVGDGCCCRCRRRHDCLRFFSSRGES